MKHRGIFKGTKINARETAFDRLQRIDEGEVISLKGKKFAVMVKQVEYRIDPFDMEWMEIRLWLKILGTAFKGFSENLKRDRMDNYISDSTYFPLKRSASQEKCTHFLEFDTPFIDKNGKVIDEPGEARLSKVKFKGEDIYVSSKSVDLKEKDIKVSSK